MSKLNSAIKVPPQYSRADLVRLLSSIDSQVNALSEGRMAANYLNATALPSGSVTPFALGDKVWKANPVVQGSAGGQYVTLGWICVSAPGAFVEMRTLTGT